MFVAVTGASALGQLTRFSEVTREIRLLPPGANRLGTIALQR